MNGSHEKSKDLYGLNIERQKSDVSTPDRNYFNSKLNNSNEVIRLSSSFGAIGSGKKTMIQRNSVEFRPSWMTQNNANIQQNVGRQSIVSQASSKLTEKAEYNQGEKTITKEFESGHRRPLSSIFQKKSTDDDQFERDVVFEAGRPSQLSNVEPSIESNFDEKRKSLTGL